MTIITKDSGTRQLPFDKKRLFNYISTNAKGLNIDIDDYYKRVTDYIETKDILAVEDMTDYLIMEAQSLVDIVAPDWDKLSARLYIKQLKKQASINRYYYSTDGYGGYKGLQHALVQNGMYSADVLDNYTDDELREAGNLIDPTKDELFTYNGLRLLASRYLTKTPEGNTCELPQERWLTIALHLMLQEPKDKRMELVAEAYWALSNLHMTVATPTLANAGKPKGQLSSCFIDTVDDSLQGIYDSNTDIARVSKHGGGVGAYMGFIRSEGASIRGVKGASGGVVPWIKQLNNTATSVDQLGTRAGAINVTLDVFHKDILAFLDLRLNNGDSRKRAHDIFITVSLPDLFMRQVENRGDWYLFDPHEVKEKTGRYLQDYYDSDKRKEFSTFYQELVDNEDISKKVVPAIQIMKRIMKSQLETGTPFMFYRDTVNKYNANNHVGMIYSSNLCMEITQNMSPTVVTEEVTQDGKIIITKKVGDFVVCNLSSVNLGHFNELGEEGIERLVNIQVRMLDNVIDLNVLPVPQATLTNEKYRSIGLGTFGLHHHLAKSKIMWDSEEAVTENERVYSIIHRKAIEASMQLAKEKGTYSVFEGSDWHTGAYFDKRGFGEDYKELKEQVMEFGLRNAYLLAVAPNMSTAQIAGSTASVDPVYKDFYYEEKKDSRLPVIAPDMSPETYAYYGGSAFKLDQLASVRQNIVRQKYIDQAISFNYYVPSQIKASKLLELHMTSWKGEVKTTYYVRTNTISVEECTWCS